MKKYFTGSLFVLWMFLTATTSIAVGNLAFLLAFAGAVDHEEKIIPNRVCLFIAASGLCEIFLSGEISVKWKMVSIVIVFLLLILVKFAGKDGIGMGDVKLLMACSFSLDMIHLFLGLAVACATAAFQGAIAVKSLRGEVAFAPHLALWITLMKIAESI